MRSNASRVTCADGDAAAQVSGTIAWPRARNASMAPCTGMLAPATASNSVSPRWIDGQPPPASNAA